MKIKKALEIRMINMVITLNLQTIKQTLEEQRANLSVFVAKKQKSSNAKEISNSSFAERALSSRKNNRETLLLDHVERQLEDIDQALKRLKKGTYGLCTNCGDSIQPARLEVIPTADLCIECQRMQDNN
jgi:RNA polymerase-binding protein DksA